MECFDQNQQHHQEPKFPNSPISSNSSTTSINNGFKAPTSPMTPNSTLKSNENNNNNINKNSAYPTTFIQADTSSFKQVVQLLTGSAETSAKHKNPLPPTAKSTGPKKPTFKLYERRSNLSNFKNLSPLFPSFQQSCQGLLANGERSKFSPRKQQEILSPSVLDFPSLVLSPVTPLVDDPFRGQLLQNSAEERAIAEKGFYLHPSPRTTPRDAEPPRLLPLFPVTSPSLNC